MKGEDAGNGLVRDSRGQSELVGVVLVLGLVLLATVAVVALGATAIEDTQRRSELQSAEQAMTVFDSRAATVALGRSSGRTVDFGESGGSYDVVPDSGRLVVVHRGWDGAGGAHELYNESLGAVVYRNGDAEVAYQGGGVWAAEGGGSRIVSPPEFHYRDGTLTLPVVRVTGTGSASGRAAASVTESQRAHPVYPNATATYPGGRSYLNPIENGNVTVAVQSQYYRAWADYFRDRTEGAVRVYDANRTATVTLVTLGTNGRFPMPGEGGSVDVRGLASHSLSDFEVTLRPDKTDSANFANLQWSLYVEEGTEQFELHLRQSGGSGCTADVSVTVYYSDDGGATHESWYEDDAFGTSCADLDGDGDDEVVLDANLADPTVDLAYTDVSQSQLLHFKPNGAHVDPVVFDQHGVDDGIYVTGDRLPLNTTVSHYLARLGPTFALTVDDKNSDSVSEDVSEGYIRYTGSGDYVTYLHVTENEVVVVFED
jgi:hypothetical protein